MLVFHKKKKVVLTLAMALGLFMSEQAAFAQNDVDEVIDLQPVQVTATRSEKDLMDVPISVTVVTAEEIAKRPGATISELLRDVPGLLMETNIQPTADRIRIRGEVTQKTLILVDGQKISDMNDTMGTMLTIDPSTIERIEVIKGAASVLYGSEAIGGVINIITKQGGQKPIQGEFSASFLGANTGIRTNLGLYGSLNGFNYRLSGAYSKLNNFESYHVEEPHSNSSYTNGSGFLSYDFNESWTAGLGGELYSREREYTDHRNTEPVGADAWTLYNNDRSKVNAFVEGRDISKYFSRVRLDAFYQTNTNDGIFHSATNAINSVRDGTTDSMGISLQTDWFFGENIFLITGYEFLQEKMDWDRDYYTGKIVTSTQHRDGTQTTHAGFALLEHTLPLDFTLNYGVRFTHIVPDLKRTERVFTSGVVRPEGLPGKTAESKPVFSAGLVWSGISNLALRASWSQGFLPATMSQKYIVSSNYIANPDLKSETSDNFEIGARYYDGKLSADVALFYSIMDNLIVTKIVSTGPDVRQRQNADDAEKYGVEAALSYTFDIGLKPYVSATYLRRKADDSWKTGIPTLTGRVGLAFDRAYSDDYWAVNADVYLQGQDAIEFEGASAYLDAPGFATLNLAFGVDWGRKHKFFAQAEILNILDKRYLTRNSSSFYQAGINANLVFGYRF